MLHVSPVLLSRLMVVLAKHLAAATRGMIPFTDSPSANQVAFEPLGSDLRPDSPGSYRSAISCRYRPPTRH